MLWQVTQTSFHVILSNDTGLRNMKVGWKEGSISSGRSLYQCGFSKPYRSDTHRHPVNPCFSNLNPVMTHVHTQTWWAIKYLPFFVTWTSRSPDNYYTPTFHHIKLSHSTASHGMQLLLLPKQRWFNKYNIQL